MVVPSEKLSDMPEPPYIQLHPASGRPATDALLKAWNGHHWRLEGRDGPMPHEYPNLPSTFDRFAAHYLKPEDVAELESIYSARHKKWIDAGHGGQWVVVLGGRRQARFAATEQDAYELFLQRLPFPTPALIRQVPAK